MGHSIKHYNGTELSNLQLGQGGFDMLSSNTNSAYGSGLDGRYMEIVNAADHPVGVEAVYTHTGAKLAAAINSSVDTITIDDGDIVETGIAANDYIVVYDKSAGKAREIMQVTAIDASANPDELTVTRNVHSYGAMSHGDNSDIFWYKNVPGISHWISIKNCSYGPSAAATSAIFQAVMIDGGKGKFTGVTSGLEASTHPVNLVNGNGGADQFDETSNVFNCILSGEDVLYGRFTKIMAGSPSANSLTALQLMRGYH